MNDLRNPYIAGAPVVETSMFFGREDVFKWIENSLTGKYVDHILVLHGQRRVGKTTVLKQIPNFLPDKYIQIFFDLQGRTNTTLDRFLWWMASEIVRSLNNTLGIDLPRIKRDQFSEPDTFITDFIPSLQPVLDGHVLLLTFDEFDTLAREDIQEQLARPLISFFRRLFEIDGLNFIFSIGSSGNKLENMQAAYTNFFKSALYRKVSFLTKDDCINLITKPVAGVITYHPKAIQRIIEITSGHPYFTQLTCHELFSRCQSSGERKVNVEDVEDILDDVIERGTVNLKFVWDEASDLEKWILAVLGAEEGLNQNKIEQVLQAQGVRFSDADLNAAILRLRDKDVLTQNNRLVIQLMKLWLEINRPMDRVREELVQTNPIADRYLEIGDEYRDRGQLEQALSSYQQALSVQANNFAALFNIATIYLEQKQYQPAASAFEKALQVDDEHIAARQGFCEAHLALGDQAREMGSLPEAIEAYQTILNLSPVHAQARQNIAGIYREQAEGYLSSGADQQALEKLQLAMEMTPEDTDLKERYEQISAQKKAALVKSWMDKADRALRRQRWDEAAAMAQEALKIDPENPALQAQFNEIKDAPRQQKLRTYQRDAETALTKGDTTKAIQALQAAASLAPEDEKIIALLASTQADHLNTQLQHYETQAEEAQTSGDWEAAIAARNAALALDPENTALAAALAETEAAQRQAQIDELRAEIQDARQGQDWEKAIQSARALKELIPEAETDRLLEELSADQRQSRLDDLLSKAQEAADQERWADAVIAWESYLEEVPGDADKYSAQLANAQHNAKLSSDYTDAQDFIKKRQFNKAIPLLQGIIAQDPTYKSTSRLLVEAVEAREQRTPIWRKPWLYGGVGLIIIVALGLIFSDQILSLFKPTPAQVSEFDTAESVENPMPEDNTPAVQTSPQVGDCASIDVLCIGLVTDFGKIDDKSFNQSAWEGVKLAEEEFGAIVNYVETADASGDMANIQLFADDNFDIIVTVGYSLGEATLEAAAMYPEIDFIAVDQDQGGSVVDNVAGLIFEEDKAGFLAGVLAGMLTETNTIAAVLGTDLAPAVVAFKEGYESGSAWANPDVTVISTYHPGEWGVAFTDPEWGAATAAQAIENGADVVFGAGGKTGNGALIETAGYDSTFCIGVDSDQWLTVPEAHSCLVSSAMKLITPGVFKLITVSRDAELVSDANFPGGNYLGEVALAPFHDHESAVSQEIVDKIEQARQGLEDGSIDTGYISDRTPENEEASRLFNTVTGYMTETPPTFEDDFNTANNNWGVILAEQSPGAERHLNEIIKFMVDGQLYFPANIGNVTFWGAQSVVKENFYTSDLIFSYSFSPQEGFEELNFRIRSFDFSSGYIITIDRLGNIYSGENEMGYMGNFDPSQMYELLVVAIDNVVAVFIDGTIVTYDEDVSLAGTSNYPIGDISSLFNGKDLIYIDDFRFWILDGTDF